MDDDTLRRDGEWPEWRRYVFETLKGTLERQHELEKEVANLHRKLDVLTVKAGFWGAGSGAVTVLAAYIVERFAK